MKALVGIPTKRRHCMGLLCDFEIFVSLQKHKYTINHSSLSRYGHLLHHVEDLLGPVQPHVVVGDGHGLEGDLLRVLEVGVRPPDAVEPLNGQQLEVIIVTAPTHVPSLSSPGTPSSCWTAASVCDHSTLAQKICQPRMSASDRGNKIFGNN